MITWECTSNILTKNEVSQALKKQHHVVSRDKAEQADILFP